MILGCSDNNKLIQIEYIQFDTKCQWVKLVYGDFK